MYESICEMFMQHNVFYILHKDCKTSGRGSAIAKV